MLENMVQFWEICRCVFLWLQAGRSRLCVATRFDGYTDPKATEKKAGPGRCGASFIRVNKEPNFCGYPWHDFVRFMNIAAWVSMSNHMRLWNESPHILYGFYFPTSAGWTSKQSLFFCHQMSHLGILPCQEWMIVGCWIYCTKEPNLYNQYISPQQVYENNVKTVPIIITITITITITIIIITIYYIITFFNRLHQNAQLQNAGDTLPCAADWFHGRVARASRPHHIGASGASGAMESSLALPTAVAISTVTGQDVMGFTLWSSNIAWKIPEINGSYGQLWQWKIIK